MVDLRQNAETLLATITGVNLNSVATTNLYTVPTDLTAWITHVVIRDISADAASAEVTFGQTGAKDDWAKRLLLGKYLNAANDSMILTPRQWLQASTIWDPGSIADGGEVATTITINDAELGDFVVASFSLDISDLVLDAQVTAADTITCVLANNTGGAVDLGSGTLRARVSKYDAGFIEYTEGEIFCIDVTTAVGSACTATIDVFGYLK